ncbi:MAG: cell wall-binding repeat-containing protein [Rhodoglobus sp.]|jgi:putative cell wall-binding protein|nr:cell wall-binding repeat-containing protein [Rhodoglobus sp.]
MSIVRRIGAVAGAIALAVTAVVAAPATEAQAITGADFNPGYIISDAQFYDNDAMTESEIQAFLELRINSVGGCTTTNCMALYRTDTTSRPADIRSGGQVICQAYQGAAQESVARIIFKVQQACGISARVLLVTMQKEQSILTARAPSSWQMKATMGYACPDTGACDTKYYGVFNQLYSAAWQLKRYSTPTYDPFGNYQPGVRYIQYNPNPACGGTNVNIQNNATAALYNYTPYQPNAESLANLYGSGGACGAHGNRNFWTYYHSWFGSPTTSGISGLPVSSRIAGVDRFDTAVKVSQQMTTGTGTVFVANGLNFPDALAAAPAAAVADAPVLLTAPDTLPATVVAELQRLKPARIVVVGGESSVSEAVLAELAAYAPSVQRVGGADRMETSRLLVQFYPRQSASEAYVVTAWGFADALAAGAAAGSKNAPILLVNGLDGAIDPTTAELIQSMGITKVTIAGSEATVSAGIAASIAALPGVTVNRLGGADRFETASLVARDAFPSSTAVYLAYGLNFPDALAGAALAASTNSALLLAPGQCVHQRTGKDIKELGATSVVLLGSPATLGSGVAQYSACD